MPCPNTKPCLVEGLLQEARERIPGPIKPPDFEQIVVERIEPQAEPQVSIQAGDGRILIEKNKHKHPSASVDQAMMEGLTTDQITEALRAYTATAKLKRPIPEEQPQLSEDSERSHRSRRSVFERINDETIRKEKKKQDKADSRDLRRKIEKETEKAKLRSIIELRDRIRKEEEAKLEEVIRQIGLRRKKRQSSGQRGKGTLPRSHNLMNPSHRRTSKKSSSEWSKRWKTKLKETLRWRSHSPPSQPRWKPCLGRKIWNTTNYDSFDGLGDPEEHINLYSLFKLI